MELGAIEGKLEAGNWFIFREERNTRVVAPSTKGFNDELSGEGGVCKAGWEGDNFVAELAEGGEGGTGGGDGGFALGGVGVS